MNAEMLMDAIGGISDRHVEKYAVIRTVGLVKSTLKKLAISAACLLLIIGVSNLIKSRVQHSDIDTVPSIDVCIVGDDYYEIVSDKNVISSRKLPSAITSDMIGTYIGECLLEKSGKTAKTYEYLGLKGDSILIVELESQYYYLFFCNPCDSDKAMPMQKLLCKYGLSDNITSISINGKTLSPTSAIAKELSEATAVTGADFNDSVFFGKSEEEQQALDKNLAKEHVIIVVRGNMSDTLAIDYYPSIGYGFSANTYYKFSNVLIDYLK